MDIARSEQVESELDAMIRRRDTHRRQTEGERREEELYEPSMRAYRERQEAERRAATVTYLLEHAERVESIAAVIAAEKRAQAHKLMHEPKGAA